MTFTAQFLDIFREVMGRCRLVPAMIRNRDPNEADDLIPGAGPQDRPHVNQVNASSEAPSNFTPGARWSICLIIVSQRKNSLQVLKIWIQQSHPVKMLSVNDKLHRRIRRAQVPAFPYSNNSVRSSCCSACSAGHHLPQASLYYHYEQRYGCQIPALTSLSRTTIDGLPSRSKELVNLLQRGKNRPYPFDLRMRDSHSPFAGRRAS